MGRPREAVDAAVLAAAIGIDRAVEADVGRVVAGDDLARGVDRNRGLERRQFLDASPAVVEGNPRHRLVAAGRVRLRAPPAAALELDRDAEQFVDAAIGVSTMGARRRGGQLLFRRALVGCVPRSSSSFIV